MKKIKTLKDLREERICVKRRIDELEEEIQEDFQSIKNDLKPWNLAGDAIRNMFESEKNDLVGESIGLGIDALVKKVIFRNSNFLVKYAISFAMKNYVRNFLSTNSENILNWIQVELRKIKSKHHHNGELYDASTTFADVEN